MYIFVVQLRIKFFEIVRKLSQFIGNLDAHLSDEILKDKTLYKIGCKTYNVPSVIKRHRILFKTMGLSNVKR